MLQPLDYLDQIRRIKNHSLSTPKIHGIKKVWKIIRQKNPKGFKVKIVAFFLLFPNMMESGPEVNAHVINGSADWLSQWCQNLMLDLILI